MQYLVPGMGCDYAYWNTYVDASQVQQVQSEGCCG